MNKIMMCGECEEKTPFEEKTVKERFEVRGESFEVTGIAHVCTICGSVRGDSLFDGLLAQANKEYRQRHSVVSTERIKEIREKRGLSQALFAKILGIGQATLQRYEKGSLPSLSLNNLLLQVQTDEGYVEMLKTVCASLSPREKEQAMSSLCGSFDTYVCSLVADWENFFLQTTYSSGKVELEKTINMSFLEEFSGLDLGISPLRGKYVSQEEGGEGSADSTDSRLYAAA